MSTICEQPQTFWCCVRRKPVKQALDELKTKSGMDKNPSFDETIAYLEYVARETAKNPTISLSSYQPCTGEVLIKAVYGEICVVHFWVNTELKTCLITLRWKEDCDVREDDSSWSTYWREELWQQRCQWTPTEEQQRESPVLILVHKLKQAFLALEPSQDDSTTKAALDKLIREAAVAGLPIGKQAFEWSHSTLHQKTSMSLADIKDCIPSMDDAILQKSTYSTSCFFRYTFDGLKCEMYVSFERISNASGKLEHAVYVESY
jgi:hypothetical protein